MSLLQATGMRGGYGAADILQGCTINCDRGEIAVIVGPNGAGKSTAIKAIFGMIDLREGDVTFEGKSIQAWLRKHVWKPVWAWCRRTTMSFLA